MRITRFTKINLIEPRKGGDVHDVQAVARKEKARQKGRARERPKPNYGSTAVMFRFGTCPTLMRVTSLIVLRSTTDTEFDPAFAT
jgi:hypothetical protein